MPNEDVEKVPEITRRRRKADVNKLGSLRSLGATARSRGTKAVGSRGLVLSGISRKYLSSFFAVNRLEAVLRYPDVDAWADWEDLDWHTVQGRKEFEELVAAGIQVVSSIDELAAQVRNQPKFQTPEFKCISDYDKCVKGRGKSPACSLAFFICITRRIVPFVR